jgi:hypothetical protein
MSTDKPKVSISILDPDEYWGREEAIIKLEELANGQPGQPPMTDRLRAVTIVVDQLERDGIRFATARDSKMNKALREWLNERMSASTDGRKSRRKKIGADAVRSILKQVSELRSRTL